MISDALRKSIDECLRDGDTPEKIVASLELRIKLGHLPERTAREILAEVEAHLAERAKH